MHTPEVHGFDRIKWCSSGYIDGKAIVQGLKTQNESDQFLFCGSHACVVHWRMDRIHYYWGEPERAPH